MYDMQMQTNNTLRYKFTGLKVIITEGVVLSNNIGIIYYTFIVEKSCWNSLPPVKQYIGK